MAIIELIESVNKYKYSVLLIITLNYNLNLINGHVALTFPPARKYDLDFLDNSRTKPPCGMPKGSIKTSFYSGSSFNVTWHLAYPHRGGFRIQLLDDLERPVLDLTPSVGGSEFVRMDATAQSFEIHIPNNFICGNCTLRLVRQADEWSSNYRFWSCADIDIKERKDFKETCSGHGKYFPSRCKCNTNFYGNRCQYWDECTKNQDCGIQGQCIDLKGTTLPRKQCYCNFGWYGPQCGKKSPYKTTDIDLSFHSMKQLSPDFQLYWRILEEQGEIEFVMRVNGTSWVGLGWRPRNLTSTCKNFPLIRDIGDYTTIVNVSSKPLDESEPEPVSEPQSNTAPQPEPEPNSGLSSKSKRVAKSEHFTTPKDGITVATSVSYRISSKTGRKRREKIKGPNKSNSTTVQEPTSESSTKSEPEPKSEPESEPTSEPEPEPKSEPEPEPKSKPEPEPKSEPVPEPKSEPEPDTKSEPELEPKFKLEPESKSEPEPEPKSNPEPEPKSEPEPGNQIPTKSITPLSANQQKKNLNSYTPRHDFNPMDCTDIIIGSARRKTSRVKDYYTRDRSTPREDEFWGGKNDLILGTGFEENGVTTIIFRRKFDAKEPTDHSFVNDLTHVIWAKGQEPGNYIHEPASGIEKEKVYVKDFYQPDELKYHGHRIQRGVTQINFFTKEKPSLTESNSAVLDNECYGNWQHPKDCVPSQHNCEYYVRWETIGRGDEMQWYIETTNTQTWTGVGFSDDDKMSRTDVIIGWVDRNGREFLMDTWINGYSPPRLDDRQDIYNTSGRIDKGVTILEFTRKRISNDEQDLSFTEDHCLHLFFPIVGGAFNAVNKKIRKHEQIPIVTPNRVCIKSCGKELQIVNTGPTTPSPNRLSYSVGVKIINLAESFIAPERGTVEFINIATAISDSFNSVLSNIPGYYKTDVLNFKNKVQSSMVAKVNVLFDKAAYEKGRSLGTEQETNDIESGSDEVKDGKLVKRTLLDSVSAGTIGSLIVDPNYLDFEPLNYKTTENDEENSIASFFQLSEIRLYTVLGCIVALILIALVQAVCTIYKTSRKKRNQKDQLIPNSAWKDYSSNTNYAFDSFGETEEKSNKGDQQQSRSSRNANNNGQGDNSSGQQTLQMSHSPTSKSQQYYETNSRLSRYESSNGLHSSGGGGGVAVGTSDRQYHNSNRYQNGDHSYMPRSTYYTGRAYSLPRTVVQHQSPLHQGYYTQDRRNRYHHHHDREGGGRMDRDRDDRGDHRTTAINHARSSSTGTDTPDFYFMPSQRKYSGEVVRVYVDYNKDSKH